MDPPIGILTRNRATYLDITLRSLSGTYLPPGVTVDLFDDASSQETTEQYYADTGSALLRYTWPADGKWQAHGFGPLPEGATTREAIGRKIKIHRNDKPQGVVLASCGAVRRLFAKTTAHGVILLQDDVLFKEDWYVQMTRTVEQHRKFTSKPVGVLAGIKLNKRFLRPKSPAISSGITAQCLYISRAAFEVTTFFTDPPQVNKRFDDLLRRRVTAAGLWGGVIYPFVCQHFGTESLVRPTKRWMTGRVARVGLHASPPYALADNVRKFDSAIEPIVVEQGE